MRFPLLVGKFAALAALSAAVVTGAEKTSSKAIYVLGSTPDVPGASQCVCDFSSAVNLECLCRRYEGNLANLLWQNQVMWAGMGYPVGRPGSEPPRTRTESKLILPYAQVRKWVVGLRLSSCPYMKADRLQWADKPWVYLTFSKGEGAPSQALLVFGKKDLEKLVVPTLKARITANQPSGEKTKPPPL